MQQPRHQLSSRGYVPHLSARRHRLLLTTLAWTEDQILYNPALSVQLSARRRVLRTFLGSSTGPGLCDTEHGTGGEERPLGSPLPHTEASADGLSQLGANRKRAIQISGKCQCTVTNGPSKSPPTSSLAAGQGRARPPARRGLREGLRVHRPVRVPQCSG